MDYSLIIVLAFVAIITTSLALIIIALCILKRDKPASQPKPLPSLAEIQKMRDIMYPGGVLISPVHDTWEHQATPCDTFNEVHSEEESMKQEMNRRGMLFLAARTEGSLVCETCKKDCEVLAEGECHSCYTSH